MELELTCPVWSVNHLAASISFTSLLASLLWGLESRCDFVRGKHTRAIGVVLYIKGSNVPF
uniref:Uncharacterized protein n=1 Tax=Arundo donax TaxID=35708 RepID=A0A0A9GJ79_ARUDO